MDEQIKTAVLELISEAKALSVEHGPKLVQDLITWAQIRGAIWLALSVLLASCLLIALRAIVKTFPSRKKGEEWSGWDTALVFLLCSVLFAGFVFLIEGASVIFAALKATFTPYAYLLDMVK